MVSFKLEFVKDLCNRCDECLEVCFDDALSFDSNGMLIVDYGVCARCESCTDICDALTAIWG